MSFLSTVNNNDLKNCKTSLSLRRNDRMCFHTSVSCITLTHAHTHKYKYTEMLAQYTVALPGAVHAVCLGN